MRSRDFRCSSRGVVKLTVFATPKSGLSFEVTEFSDSVSSVTKGVAGLLLRGAADDALASVGKGPTVVGSSKPAKSLSPGVSSEPMGRVSREGCGRVGFGFEGDMSARTYSR